MPRSFETTSRRRADKLISEFLSTYTKLSKVAQQLRALRPFAREAYFRSLVHSPKDAAHISWVFFRLGNDPIREFESAAFNLPPNATYADVLILLEEHVASRGWTEKVLKALMEISPEAARAAAQAEKLSDIQVEVQSEAETAHAPTPAETVAYA